MRALYTAATGMAAQELNVQVISNNIANMRTTGYKKQRAAFQDLIYDHVRRVGAQASDQGTILPVGVDIGGGEIITYPGGYEDYLTRDAGRVLEIPYGVVDRIAKLIPEGPGQTPEEALKPGNTIAGPAIIESDATTFVVPLGFATTIDKHRLFHLKEVHQGDDA